MSIAREPGRLHRGGNRARSIWWATGLGLAVGTMLFVVTRLVTSPTASVRPSPGPASVATPRSARGEATRPSVGQESKSRLAQVEIEERRLPVAPPPRPRQVPVARPASAPIRERPLSSPPVRPQVKAPQPIKPTLAAMPLPAAAPKPTLVGENLDAPLEPEERPEARYPEDAAAEGVTGKVRMKVVVDPVGQVEDALVVRSSGDERLDRAAEEAVRRWRYRAARRGGKAVPATDYVEVEFFRASDENSED